VSYTHTQIICVNYQDTSNGTGPAAIQYPFYAVNSGVLYQQGTYAGRVDTTGTLGTTAGSATVQDTNAVAGDAGKIITGTGIPVGAAIKTATAATGYTLTVPANATGTPASLTIGGIPAAGTYGEMFYYATDTLALYHSSGATWTQVNLGSGVTVPQVNFYTAGATWTKPTSPAPTTVFAYVLGSGGAGGSGASGVSGTVQCGGGGGAGAIVERRQFAASDLPSTVTVTVGAAPNGGAAVTGMTPRVDTTAGGTTNGSTTVTDANAATGDVGRSITGTGIPANATITAVNAGVGYTISAAATATASSLTFTIGTNTPGLAGTGGNLSSFGNYLRSYGALQGSGGTNLTGTGATSAGLTSTNLGGGAAASTTGGAGVGLQPSVLGAPGGASGGGITTGAAAGAGAAGNVSTLAADATAGTAGVVGGASPGQGVASTLANGSCGPSPGSGAASTSGAAQGGANALANSGAGGSGGGASLNGYASGAGGNGGSGWVLVVAYFQ
jgi:hypothetical protein